MSFYFLLYWNFNDFFVVNVVVVFGIILEHSSVRSNYLKKMVILNFFIYNWTILIRCFNFFIINSMKLLSNTYHHSACVFDNVHWLRFQNRNQNEWVSSFQNINTFMNRFKELMTLVQVNSYPKGHNLSISLRKRNNLIFFLKFLFKLMIIFNQSIMN